MTGTSNEISVGTKLDIFRTRSVIWKPIDERWSIENLDMIGGVLWRKSDDDEKQDGEKMADRELTEEEKQDLKDEVELKKMIPRRFAILVRDVEKFGPSEACGGCKAMIKRKPGQVHSEVCRRRFEKLLGGEERVKVALDRENEFYEKAAEFQSQKEARPKPEVVVKGGPSQSASSGLNAHAREEGL